MQWNPRRNSNLLHKRFRERLHTKYKSSTKARSFRKKKRRGSLENEDEDSELGMASCSKYRVETSENDEGARQRKMHRITHFDSDHTPRMTTLHSFSSQQPPNSTDGIDVPWGSPPKRRRTSSTSGPNVPNNTKEVVDLQISTQPLIAKIEGTLRQAMEDVLPPPDPHALYSLCMLQLHLIQRLSIESARTEIPQL